MLKLAYQLGVQAALKEFGLTKEAFVAPGVGAAIGALGAEPGEGGKGALRGAGAGIGGQLGAALGFAPGGRRLTQGKGNPRIAGILALLGLLGGGAAGGYGGYQGMKALTGG